MNFKNKRISLKNKLKQEDNNLTSSEVSMVQPTRLKVHQKIFRFLTLLHWKTKLKRPRKTKLKFKKTLNQPKGNPRMLHQKLNQLKQQSRKQNLKIINWTIRQRNSKRKEANLKKISQEITKNQSMRKESLNNCFNWETKRLPLRKRPKKKLKNLKSKRTKPMI